MTASDVACMLVKCDAFSGHKQCNVICFSTATVCGGQYRKLLYITVWERFSARSGIACHREALAYSKGMSQGELVTADLADEFGLPGRISSGTDQFDLAQMS